VNEKISFALVQNDASRLFVLLPPSLSLTSVLKGMKKSLDFCVAMLRFSLKERGGLFGGLEAY